MGGFPTIEANVVKIKAEAERLEVTDKAAGILAELLYTEKLLTEIKQYRTIMLHVSLGRAKLRYHKVIFLLFLTDSLSLGIVKLRSSF